MPLSLALLALGAAPVAIVAPADEGSRPAAAIVARLLDEQKIGAKLVEPGSGAGARGDFTLTVTAAEVRGRTALDLELVSRRTGKRLDTRAVDGPSGDVASFAREAVRALAGQMRAAAPPKPKPDAVDAVEPTASRLEDDQPEPEPVTAPAPRPPAPVEAPVQPAAAPALPLPASPPPEKPWGLRVALLVAAVGSAAASITFGVLTAQARGRLGANENGVSALRWSEAGALAGTSNVYEGLMWGFTTLSIVLLAAAFFASLAQ